MAIALGITTLILGGPVAATAGTAKEAIAALRRSKGENAVRNIVAMRGLKGQDQPASWEIVTNQPSLGGYRRYVVTGGKLRAENPMTQTPSKIVVKLDKMRLDSSQAFQVANREATKQLIGFDSLDYELRAVDYSYSPVWRIVLRNGQGAAVGRLEVSAESGKVRWPRAPATPKKAAIQPVDYEMTNTTTRGGASYVSTPASSESLPISERTIDYSKYEGRDYRDGRDPVKARERNYVWWHQTTDGLEYAGHNLKDGFRETGAAFRDIFTGEAVYRSTGKKKHLRKASHTRPSRVRN